MEESNVVVLTTEDGQDMEFNIVASLDVNEDLYFVLSPKDEEEDGVVIFKSVDITGEEETLEIVEDEEELDAVLDAFEELMNNQEN
jgi:hypothetical protein